MSDRTPEWKERQDRLGLPNQMVALATGVSLRSVESYRGGKRAPEAWVARVETFLTNVERAVLGRTAA